MKIRYKKIMALGMLLLTLFMASTVSAIASIPAPPKTSIYVQDYANILSVDSKTKINNIGADIAKKTKAQVVVVTIPSLEGMSIDNYSLELFRKWGIGDRKLNNGVLILIALKERKSRIEVGYGLEGALPDAKTGRVQDQHMLPYFKKGDYDKGIINGYAALVSEVAKEYKITSPAGAVNSSKAKDDGFDIWAVAILGIILSIIIGVIMFIGRLIRRLFGGSTGNNHTINNENNSWSSNNDSGSSSDDDFGGGSSGGGGSDRDW